MPKAASGGCCKKESIRLFLCVRRDEPAQCAPRSFFSSCRKKERAAPGVRKKRALSWSQVTACGQNHVRRRPNVGMSWAFQCSLPLWCTARRVYIFHTGGSAQKCCACRGRRARRPETFYTASRDFMWSTIFVRNAIERQRYAWPAATRTCYSGDLRSALRLPLRTWGQGETSPCRLSLECKNRFFPRTGKKWFLKRAACHH